MKYKVYKPENKIIRFSDFKRPKIYGMHAFREIPYIDIKGNLSVTPLILDVSDIPIEKRIEITSSGRHEFEGKFYIEEKAWEICADGSSYYVIVYEMSDPTFGICGSFARWHPFQTVLFDENREPVSEHSETGNAAHVRVVDCKTPESLIRHLTVWGMIDSDYRNEIIKCNEDLKDAYKDMIVLRDKIINLYKLREAITENNKVRLYDMADNTYKEFLVRNEELLQSEEEIKLLVKAREIERKNRDAYNELLSDVLDKLQ